MVNSTRPLILKSMSEMKKVSNKELLQEWLIKERGELMEDVSNDDAMGILNPVISKMDKGFIRIEDGFIIQTLRKPIGETKELKFKQFYTAGDQSKAARNMKSEGELSMAHNLIACLTGITQGEVRKLMDKDITTASEIEGLYFL